MNRTFRILSILAAALVAFAVTPALAVGPVEVEAGALYWVHDLEVESEGESIKESADAEALFAELWVNKLGFRAAWYKSDVDERMIKAEVDYKSLDARWKILKLTDSNFVALGAGWQQIDIDAMGESADSSGIRFVVDGNVGLGKLVYLYGEYVYYLEMDGFSVDGLSTGDLDGYELEFGVSLKPFPFLNLKAGYRISEFEYDIEGATETWTPDGYYAGVSFNF